MAASGSRGAGASAAPRTITPKPLRWSEGLRCGAIGIGLGLLAARCHLNRALGEALAGGVLVDPLEGLFREVGAIGVVRWLLADDAGVEGDLDRLIPLGGIHDPDSVGGGLDERVDLVHLPG